MQTVRNGFSDDAVIEAPNTNRTVATPDGQEPAVRGKRQGPHVSNLSRKGPGHRLAVPHFPKPDAVPVGATRGEELVVRGESQREHRAFVSRDLDEIARDNLPEFDDSVAVTHCEHRAVWREFQTTDLAVLRERREFAPHFQIPEADGEIPALGIGAGLDQGEPTAIRGDRDRIAPAIIKFATGDTGHGKARSWFREVKDSEDIIARDNHDELRAGTKRH